MSIVEVRIGQRFRLNGVIGKGLFSEVFEGILKSKGENVYTGERVAIKLEDVKIRYPQVNFEYQILKHLQGGCKMLSFSGNPSSLLVWPGRRLHLSCDGVIRRKSILL